MQVHVETSRFKSAPFYRNSAGTTINPPTAYTPHLIEKGLALLKKIFRPGLRYKSCGVILTDLSLGAQAQEVLYEEQYQDSRGHKLMQVIDGYNRRTNTGKVFLAAEGLGKPWYMKQAHRSKRFTTRWNELLEIRI